MKIYTNKETTTIIDEQGKETTTIKETSSKSERNTEPDFIKLYTKMWCEFNDIPDRWRNLFMQLVVRMSYCNSTDMTHSQIITVYGLVTEDICKACGWTDKSNVRRGLKVLCECGAIKKVGRATYQINPNYAGRGEWKYNPKLNRGGVEDLVATFNFRDKSVKTNIVWADDGSESEVNDMYRRGLGVKASDETVIKTIEQLPGQMCIDDLEDVPQFKETVTC